PLVEKKEAVNVIRLAEISGQAGPESAHIRIVQAKAAPLASFEIDFCNLSDTGHISAEHVFDRAKKFHLPFARRRQNFRDDIQVAKLRRARLLQNRSGVKLWM